MVAVRTEGQQCPVCAERKRATRLQLYQINMVEAMLMCPLKKCTFPIGHGRVHDLIIARKARDVTLGSKRKQTTEVQLCSTSLSGILQPPKSSPGLAASHLSPKSSPGLAASHLSPKSSPGLAASHLSPKSSPGLAASHLSPKSSPGLAASHLSPKSSPGLAASHLSPKSSPGLAASHLSPKISPGLAASLHSPRISPGLRASLQSPKISPGLAASPHSPKISPGLAANPHSPKSSLGLRACLQSPKISPGLAASPHSPKISPGLAASPHSPKSRRSVDEPVSPKYDMLADNTSNGQGSVWPPTNQPSIPASLCSPVRQGNDSWLSEIIASNLPELSLRVSNDVASTATPSAASTESEDSAIDLDIHLELLDLSLPEDSANLPVEDYEISSDALPPIDSAPDKHGTSGGLPSGLNMEMLNEHGNAPLSGPDLEVLDNTGSGDPSGLELFAPALGKHASGSSPPSGLDMEALGRDVSEIVKAGLLGLNEPTLVPGDCLVQRTLCTSQPGLLITSLEDQVPQSQNVAIDHNSLGNAQEKTEVESYISKSDVICSVTKSSPSVISTLLGNTSSITRAQSPIPSQQPCSSPVAASSSPLTDTSSPLSNQKTCRSHVAVSASSLANTNSPLPGHQACKSHVAASASPLENTTTSLPSQQACRSHVPVSASLLANTTSPLPSQQSCSSHIIVSASPLAHTTSPLPSPQAYSPPVTASASPLANTSSPIPSQQPSGSPVEDSTSRLANTLPVAASISPQTNTSSPKASQQPYSSPVTASTSSQMNTGPCVPGQQLTCPVWFPQWKNKESMCWMDVSLCLLVHLRTVRVVADLLPQYCPLAMLLKAYDHAKALLGMYNQNKKTINLETSVGTVSVKTGGGENLLQSPQVTKCQEGRKVATKEDLVTLLPESPVGVVGVATAACEVQCVATDDGTRDTSEDSGIEEQCQMLLDVAREKVWSAIAPKLHCKRGNHDSPVFALPLIVDQHAELAECLMVHYTWKMVCCHCDYQHFDKVERLMPTFPNVPSDFSMMAPCFIRSCFNCGAPRQRMNMVFNKLPPVVTAHFVEGLPNSESRLSSYDFCYRGLQYHVVAAVQYKTNPNHFVAWLRNPKDDTWMECDDLYGRPCSFSQVPPSFPASQVHVLVWERDGDVGPGKDPHQQQVTPVQKVVLAANTVINCDSPCRIARQPAGPGDTCVSPREQRCTASSATPIRTQPLVKSALQSTPKSRLTSKVSRTGTVVAEASKPAVPVAPLSLPIRGNLQPVTGKTWEYNMKSNVALVSRASLVSAVTDVAGIVVARSNGRNSVPTAKRLVQLPAKRKLSVGVTPLPAAYTGAPPTLSSSGEVDMPLLPATGTRAPSTPSNPGPREVDTPHIKYRKKAKPADLSGKGRVSIKALSEPGITYNIKPLQVKASSGKGGIAQDGRSKAVLNGGLQAAPADAVPTCGSSVSDDIPVECHEQLGAPTGVSINAATTKPGPLVKPAKACRPRRIADILSAAGMKNEVKPGCSKSASNGYTTGEAMPQPVSSLSPSASYLERLQPLLHSRQGKSSLRAAVERRQQFAGIKLRAMGARSRPQSPSVPSSPLPVGVVTVTDKVLGHLQSAGLVREAPQSKHKLPISPKKKVKFASSVQEKCNDLNATNVNFSQMKPLSFTPNLMTQTPSLTQTSPSAAPSNWDSDFYAICPSKKARTECAAMANPTTPVSTVETPSGNIAMSDMMLEDFLDFI